MKLNKTKAKKLGMIAVVILGVLILISLLIPLVVNIDNFRPKILEAVGQKIRGRVEIGHLKLRLLGGIGASVDGVKLYGSKKFDEKEILAVENVRIKISIFSLISRKPNATLILNSPNLTLELNKEGVWNVVDVAGKEESDTAEAPITTKEKVDEIPGIIKNAKISLVLNNATVTINDALAGKRSTIRDLDLELRDLGLDSPIKYSISFDASGDYKNYIIKGPLNSAGKLKIKFKEKEIESGYINAKLDCKDMDFEQTGVFQKGEGIPCGLNIDADIKNNILTIKNASVELHTLKAKVHGQIEQLTTGPVIDIKFSMNKVRLKDWSAVLFALKKSPLSADLSMDLSMKGAIRKPLVYGNLEISDGNGKISGIAAPISNLNGKFAMKGEEVVIDKLKFNVGRNPVDISGQLTDITNPYLDFSLSTPALNLNEVFEKGGSKAMTPSAKSEGGKAVTKMSKGGSQNNFVFLNKFRGKGNIKIGQLKVGKANLSNFAATTTIGGGALSVAQTANAWGGEIKSNTVLASSGGYKFNGSVSNLNLVSMAKDFGSKEAAFKGYLFGNLNLSGAGLSTDDMKRNLTGAGSMRVSEGELADLNVGRQVKAALATISALSGAPIHQKDFDQKFQRISADVQISGGKIQTNNAVATTSELDLIGAGYATLDQILNFHGTVHVPPAYINIMNIDLTDQSGKVPIPFQLTGTASNPKFNLDVARLTAHIAIKVAENEIKKRILGAPGTEASPLPLPIQIPVQLNELFKR